MKSAAKCGGACVNVLRCWSSYLRARSHEEHGCAQRADGSDSVWQCKSLRVARHNVGNHESALQIRRTHSTTAAQSVGCRPDHRIRPIELQLSQCELLSDDDGEHSTDAEEDAESVQTLHEAKGADDRPGHVVSRRSLHFMGRIVQQRTSPVARHSSLCPHLFPSFPASASLPL